jgi:hypothetical protein
MKRLSLFLTILLLLTVFVGCSDKKAPAQKHKKEYVFSPEDSTEVLNLVGQFTKYLEGDDLRSAVEMLNILKGDSIFPLEPVQQRRQAMALSIVKGVRYDVNYLVFKSDKDNEVKLDITLFEKEENDPKPNKISFYFRPVRFEGKWYLTTKDNITDRENDNSFIEEEGEENSDEE